MQRLSFAIIVYGLIAFISFVVKMGSNGRAGGTTKKIDLFGSSEDYDPAPPKGDVDIPPEEPLDIAKTIDGWADKLEDSLGGIFTTEDAEEEDKEPFSWRAKEEEGEETPVYTPTTSPTFQTEDHDHIPSTALDKEKRLEQLEGLREAGLLDEGEYKAKKREITGK